MTKKEICVRGWYYKDEKNWENGIVKCRVIPAASAKTDGNPPKWCKFVLEHTVSENAE